MMTSRLFLLPLFVGSRNLFWVWGLSVLKQQLRYHTLPYYSVPYNQVHNQTHPEVAYVHKRRQLGRLIQKILMSPKDLDAENDNAERGGGTTRFWNSTQSSSTTLEDTTMTLADAMKNNSAFTRTTCTATKFDLLAELRGLLALAFPSVALQFNMYVVYPLAASTVGHLLGTQELAGFSLGCLVGNLTCLSITVGVLTAADTLMPRAYGAGRYAEVGRLAVRAMAVGTAALAVPMIPLCAVLEPVMVFLGQDPVPARLAAEWIRIYLLGVPATLLLRTLQRFLVAQSEFGKKS